MSEFPRARRFPRLWWVLVAVLLGAGVWMLQAWVQAPRPHPAGVVLLLQQDGSLPDSDLRGLHQFLADSLELLSDLSVSSGSDDGTVPPEALLRVQVRRKGDLLGLQILPGGALPPLDLSPMPPAEALRTMTLRSGLALRRDLADALWTPRPSAFWLAIQALGTPSTPEGLALAHDLVAQVRQADPGWAFERLLTGHVQVQRLLAGLETSPEAPAQTLHILEGGLASLPAHPMGLFDLVRTQVDSGAARPTLTLLLEACASRPRSKGAFLSLAYAARYAGHLDLALAADHQREVLNPRPDRPPRNQVSYLYAGHLEAFARSLYEVPESPANTLVHFYRGHLALREGKADAALAHFRKGEASRPAFHSMGRMCRAYRLLLQHQEAAARTELEELLAERAALRLPDGEVTLMAAEAYALLGDADAAMAHARLAYTHGFACLPFYLNDPLLAPIRSHPRWPQLLDHLQLRVEPLVASVPIPRWRL